MRQTMSFSDWQKIGGAKDYNALHVIGCAPITDEEVAQGFTAKTGYPNICAPIADEGLAQAAGPTLNDPHKCLAPAD